MIGIYYRVSTEDQTLASQEVMVNKWLGENYPNDKTRIYKDLGMSGANSKRPGLNKLIGDVERGKITHIVVYRLDRLTRDSRTAIRLVLRFDEMGVIFTSVSQPMFSEDMPFRHAIIAIFADFAQMEREMIVERVKAGLAAAVKRGVKLGAPIKVDATMIKSIYSLRDKGNTYKKIAGELGISKGSVSKVMKEREKEAQQPDDS